MSFSWAAEPHEVLTSKGSPPHHFPHLLLALLVQLLHILHVCLSQGLLLGLVEQFHVLQLILQPCKQLGLLLLLLPGTRVDVTQDERGKQQLILHHHPFGLLQYGLHGAIFEDPQEGQMMQVAGVSFWMVPTFTEATSTDPEVNLALTGRRVLLQPKSIDSS